MTEAQTAPGRRCATDSHDRSRALRGANRLHGGGVHSRPSRVKFAAWAWLNGLCSGTLPVSMADIVLTTLNAKYIHAAFGLRYLLANLGPLQASACIAEFDIHQRPLDVAEVLLSREPRLIGFGVYIWNVAPTTEVVAAIKRLRPDITLILGGPEVSYELETQPIVQLADYVITGEADLKFAELCKELLSGRRPAAKIIPAELPEFSQLALPYELYDDQDVAHRIIYVEASRGCPFTCEFCLSSLDIPLRRAPLPPLPDHLHRPP